MTEEKKNSWGDIKRTGIISGSIACLLAFYAFTSARNIFSANNTIFVYVAGIVAIFGTVYAIVGKNRIGLGLNVLAWIFIFLAYIAWSSRRF